MSHLKALSILGALGLAACAQNPYQVAAEAKIAPRFAAAIVETGPQFFCVQPAWQKCLERSESQCIADMQDFKENCRADATAMGGAFTSILKAEDFFKVYLACLSTAHMSKRNLSSSQVNQCLVENPLNKDLLKAWATNNFKPFVDEAKRDAKAAEAKDKATAAAKTAPVKQDSKQPKRTTREAPQ